MNLFSVLCRASLIVISLLISAACERDTDDEVAASTAVVKQAPEPGNSLSFEPAATASIAESGESSTQFNIGNTRYLFDVSDHSADELEALLYRAEEIRETHAEGYEDLEIVLVLHGPDINIFRQENYSKHKPVVDLAAKLDAFDIIDMKICETTMSNMGVERSEVPAFIESVPFAPDEIRRLGEQGYINL